MKHSKKGFTLLELVCVMAIMGFLFVAILSMTTPSQKIHRKTAVNENTYAIADNVQQYLQRTLDYADAAWVFSDIDEQAVDLKDTVEDFRKCYYKNVVAADMEGSSIKTDFVEGKIYILHLINKGPDAGQIGLITTDFESDVPIIALGSEELILNPVYFEGDNTRFNVTYAMNPSEIEYIDETNRNGDSSGVLKSEKDAENIRKSIVGQSLSVIVNQGEKRRESGVTVFEGPIVLTIANIPFSNIAAKMSIAGEGDAMYGAGVSRRTVQETATGETFVQGSLGTPSAIDFDPPSYFDPIENMTSAAPNAFCNFTTGKVSTENDIYYVFAYASDLVKK